MPEVGGAQHPARTRIRQHPPLSSHSIRGAEVEAQPCGLLTLPLTQQPVWGGEGGGTGGQ